MDQNNRPQNGVQPQLAEALFGQGGSEQAHAKLQAEMEAMGEKLRTMVLQYEPKQLIGYFWGQLLMLQLKGEPVAGEADNPVGLDDLMFVLEYVHATLSSHPAAEHGTARASDEVAAMLNVAAELRQQTLIYCLVASSRVSEGLFGPETGMVAMQAMSSWVNIRGHRHQALEGEFFEFVLRPHDAALREAYGVGARDISEGIQAAVDATRYGHMKAAMALQKEANAAYDFAEQEGVELGDAMERYFGIAPERRQAAASAIESLLFGGICNVSKASGLPESLLLDLSYAPGEEREFFAPGPLRGTPLLRMPGRVRPLVALDDGCYLCDANFIRDSAYRALQWGLLRRLPAYSQAWTQKQTELTEGAFAHIFANQLAGAEVLTSIYYPDPDTGAWVENDVLILLNDVLLQVEVKAGVMPMHSPELFFERHVRTIQDLVIKAHHQCERFLRYAASAEEVPIFQLVEGQHKEVRRLRLNSFRSVVPIGLTVEAFTPFSSMSKRLPDIGPILGKFPFVSMSIDDLFVLTRFLPTTGELMHYLSVRQGVAGVLEAVVFDEMDHLGSYVLRNRADMFYAEKVGEGVNWLADTGTCEMVEAYFADPDWHQKEPPRQTFPPILKDFLQTLDTVRGPRFLEADAVVRDMGSDGREDMASHISKLLPTLQQYPYRWFTLQSDDEPVMVWLQRASYVDFVGVHIAKAQAAALVAVATQCSVLIAYVNPDGTFAGGWAGSVKAPRETDSAYAERLLEAQRMESRSIALTPKGAQQLVFGNSRTSLHYKPHLGI